MPRDRTFVLDTSAILALRGDESGAARLKMEGKLSVADSWIGATAIVRDARLVHKDQEFKLLKQIPQQILSS